MGFFDSAMKTYSFVDRAFARPRAEARLEEDRARADQDRQRDIQWQEEDRARQDKAVKGKEELNTLRAFSFRRKNDPNYTPSPQELQLIAPFMDDDKVQGLMSKIYENPEAAKESLTKARATMGGKGKKSDMIDFMNQYLGEWVNAGNGGKKEISDLIPVEGQIVPELKVTGEDGKARQAPMTTYRGTEDRYLRGLDPEAGAALLDHMEEAIDQAIVSRGGTGPITRQAAGAKTKKEMEQFRQKKDYEASKKRHTLSPGQAMYDASGKLLAKSPPKDEGLGRTFQYRGQSVTGKDLTNRIKQLAPFLKNYGKTSGLDLNFNIEDIDAMMSSSQSTTWLKHVQGLATAQDTDPQTRAAAKEYVDLVNTYLGVDPTQAPAQPQAPQIDSGALQAATQKAVQAAEELKTFNPFDTDYAEYGGSKEAAIQQLTNQFYQELTGTPLAPPSGSAPGDGQSPAGAQVGSAGGLPPTAPAPGAQAAPAPEWNPSAQGLADFNLGQQSAPEQEAKPTVKKLTSKELAKAVKEASTLEMPETGSVLGENPQAPPEIKAPNLFHKELEDKAPGKTIIDPKRRAKEHNALAFMGRLRELGASKEQALKEAMKKYPDLVK